MVCALCLASCHIPLVLSFCLRFRCTSQLTGYLPGQCFLNYALQTLVESLKWVWGLWEVSNTETFLNSQWPKLNYQHGMKPRDLWQCLPVLQTTAPPQPWLWSENIDILHCSYVCLQHTLPMLPEAPWHRFGVCCLLVLLCCVLR